MLGHLKDINVKKWGKGQIGANYNITFVLITLTAMGKCYVRVLDVAFNLC
jgi:hypothetical protein